MWKEAQQFESGWWGDCTNTLSEEMKQMEYAKLMELKTVIQQGKIWIESNKSVIDMGSGPVSMLLKTTPVPKKRRLAVDPIKFPEWVYDRYANAGIEYKTIKGEDFEVKEADYIYDECWMYNCLQHTEDPRKIIENIKKSCSTLRIFEWCEVETNVGHIHTLHKTELDYWLGKEGEVKVFNTPLMRGLAYFNVVKF